MPPTEIHQKTDGRDVAIAVALILCAGMFLIVLAPAMQLWDRDEPFYARVAVEMLRSGDWIVPTFNGDVFPDKPPLVYWMMAVGIKLFGENEFAVRLPAILGMMASLAFTWAIARRMFDAITAHWSVVILATSLMAIYLGAAAMLDTVLLATITMAFWAWLRLKGGEGTVVNAGFLLLAFALSLLAKGPVGPAVFGSAVVLTWAIGPRSNWPRMGELLALAITGFMAIAIFLVWAVPANRESGGVMLQDGFWVHIIGRALAPMQGHGGKGMTGYLLNLPFYVPVVIIGLMPWVIDLPQTLVALIRGQLGEGRYRALLIAWPATTFVLFTVAATKLPHYVFPLFPATAILLAAYHRSRSGEDFRDKPGLRRAGEITYALLQAGAVLALLALSWYLRAFGAAVLAVFLAAVTVYFLKLRRDGRMALAHRVAAVAVPPFFLMAYWSVAPAVEAITKTAPAVVRSIEDAGYDHLPVFSDNTLEPSLVFALSRDPDDPVRHLPLSGEEAASALIEQKDAVIVVAKPLYDEIAKTVPEGSLQILSQHTAFDINKAGREGMTIVARFTAPKHD